MMYESIKLYSYEDVKRLTDSGDIERTYRAWEKKTINRPQEFRTFLNKKAYMKSQKKNVLMDFYGDKEEGLEVLSRGEQYRIYWALFYNRAYIEKSFLKINNMNSSVLDMLLFVGMLKFFTMARLYEFFECRKMNIDGTVCSSTSQIFKALKKHGYIEPVDYGDKSLYKKYRKAKTVYQITPKTSSIIDDYYDYVMYRKKLPYMGTASVSGVPRAIDISHKRFDNRGIYSPHAYASYQSAYEFINYKAEVEFFDGNMEEFVKSITSKDFPFHPMIYRISEQKLMESNGKKSGVGFINKFLSAHRWGIKV